MQGLKSFKSRFFLKVYLTYAAIFFSITAVMWVFVYNKFHSILMDEIKVSLRDKLELLTPYATTILVHPDNQASLRLLKEFSEKTESRISIISPNGTVIADSDLVAHSLENHKERTEIQEATQHGYGFARRYSTSGQEEMIYLAKAVWAKDRLIGFLRVSFANTKLLGQLHDVKTALYLIGLLGVASALFVGYWYSRKLIQPISEISAACEAIGKGNYNVNIRNLPKDEIGFLGSTLNRLGRELNQRIATITRDKAQLNSMLSALTEGIVGVDENCRILFCNQTAYNLLNPNIKDCRGEHIENVEGFDILGPLIHNARITKNIAKEELAIKRDIVEMIVETYASPYKKENEEGAIVVLHDVTQIRHLEGIRQDFFANVSHELKTPLTAIKGYSETLLSGALQDETVARKFIERVDQNAKRLVALVQDILSIAHIESNVSDAQLEPVDWCPILRQTISRYEGEISEKRLEVESRGADVPFYVIGEREGMLHIFENIFTNAIRYTPDKGKITVQLRSSGDKGFLEVIDTGIGILQKDLGRIFERFYRVDKARSRNLGGTGLGLSIVKHLISNMSGTIEVKSEVGRGSLFRAILPLDLGPSNGCQETDPSLRSG